MCRVVLIGGREGCLVATSRGYTCLSRHFFVGILYGMAALGPGFGYIIGGQLLDVWVDFDKVDASK